MHRYLIYYSLKIQIMWLQKLCSNGRESLVFKAKRDENHIRCYFLTNKIQDIWEMRVIISD